MTQVEELVGELSLELHRFKKTALPPLHDNGIEYQLAAGKEYQHKTTGPHQLWATDASYFRVVGWGYYYLVTVMDDYSQFILAWKVQRNMTADSLIEVVQEAVDSTGMTDVPLLSQ